MKRALAETSSEYSFQEKKQKIVGDSDVTLSGHHLHCTESYSLQGNTQKKNASNHKM